MKTLNIFKDDLINEGEILRKKIVMSFGDFDDSYGNDAVLNVLSYKFSPEQLDQNVLIEEYYVWLNKVIDCDSANEISGIIYPINRNDFFNQDEIKKVTKNIEKINLQLSSLNRIFHINTGNKSITIYDDNNHKISIFSGDKMVRIFNAFSKYDKSFSTDELNTILGYSPFDKGEITKLKNRINKKFIKDSQTKIQVIESGHSREGYRVNRCFIFKN